MLAQARNTLTIIKGNVYIRIAWIISYFHMKAKMNLTTVTNAINDSSSSQKGLH